MARTKDSATADLGVAHAAMRFIEVMGLTNEFYASGALTGRLCDETCQHAASLLEITEEKE